MKPRKGQEPPAERFSWMDPTPGLEYKLPLAGDISFSSIVFSEGFIIALCTQ